MELTSRQTLPVPQAQAWEALNDTELLKKATPGCESMTTLGENRFELVVAAAIGPVKARFKSKLALLDVQAPDSYTMQFDGQGGPAGFGKGTAKVRLEPGEAGTTILHYSVNAQVGGKIAQVGSRLVDMAAQKMAKDFFENFERAIVEKYPPAAPPPAPVEAPVRVTLFARLIAALRKMFGLD